MHEDCARMEGAEAQGFRGGDGEDWHMIARRDFISLLGGAVAAWPLAARAQQPDKIWRIGIVVEGMRSPAYDGFLQGMDELGYVAGKNYMIEWRFADARYLRILELVGAFAKLNIGAIFLSR